MLRRKLQKRNALKECRSVYAWARAASQPLSRPAQPSSQALGAVNILAGHFQGTTRDSPINYSSPTNLLYIYNKLYTTFQDTMDLNDEDGPPELVDANEAAAIVEQADNIKVPLTLVTGI